MSSDASEPAVRRFRSAVEGRFGWAFDDAKLASLGDVLARRALATGRSVAAYVERLEREPSSSEELRALAAELTVPETYFLRHKVQFDAFAALGVAPRAAGSPLRLLSAGCASGEEAYSLAMVGREREGSTGEKASVLGIDVNPRVLEKARRGRYSPWSLRDTPAEVQSRWFRKDGREFVIAPTLCERVTFEERNLIDGDAAVLGVDAYDVIFCRNVLMYFTRDVASKVVERLATALAPRGYLFLGHAETLRELSSSFELVHTHDTFYYRKKGSRLEASALPGHAACSHRTRGPTAMGWLEAVRGSTDRIEALSARADAAARPAPDPAADLGPTLALIAGERFREADEALARLPETTDPRVRLVRAALLFHLGDPGHAEAECDALLCAGAFVAAAEYLRALCREGAGDHARAAFHYRAAARVDPAFAMPRLHLGLIARRSGDRDAARRELSEASLLFGHEDELRVALFGGGFSRAGLASLCRAELRSLGERG